MSEPSEPHDPVQDLALAPALKRGADVRGRLVPVPVARIKALGIRRRRRVLATAAACVVCVLGGGGALATAQLDPDPRPGAPVVEPTPVSSCLTASPPDSPMPGSFDSPASSVVEPAAGSGPMAGADSTRPASSNTTSTSVTIRQISGSATDVPSADNCDGAATAPDVSSSPTGAPEESTAAVVPSPGL
ncbi:hypothetical protein E4N62_36370 [Streptomyces sp. MNU76]|uniref:hypothetical protein n=1 Tax=Streptomyces sp. MNU76 TaxID=2560026 RepID=UPI001E32425A|nr:hypothetical protein [Streptomyces sp. MNU76]MCC9710260.1 hypothetical protein [Streptomyces sp. MNU76]